MSQNRTSFTTNTERKSESDTCDYSKQKEDRISRSVASSQKRYENKDLFKMKKKKVILVLQSDFEFRNLW